MTWPYLNLDPAVPSPQFGNTTPCGCAPRGCVLRGCCIVAGDRLPVAMQHPQVLPVARSTREASVVFSLSHHFLFATLISRPSTLNLTNFFTCMPCYFGGHHFQARGFRPHASRISLYYQWVPYLHIGSAFTNLHRYYPYAPLQCRLPVNS